MLEKVPELSLKVRERNEIYLNKIIANQENHNNKVTNMLMTLSNRFE